MDHIKRAIVAEADRLDRIGARLRMTLAPPTSIEQAAECLRLARQHGTDEEKSLANLAAALSGGIPGRVTT